MSESTTVEFAPDVTVRERGYRIGAIGAGMIMADVHLEAYRQAGFTVTAIASRTESKARELAERYGIPTVHRTPEELIADPEVDIVDIAFPPDLQPALMRAALAQDHVKAVLAQKPLALDARRGGRAARRGRRGGQDPLGQPEHALRPVDPSPVADPRARASSATSSSRRSTCARSRTGRPSWRTTTG